MERIVAFRTGSMYYCSQRFVEDPSDPTLWPQIFNLFAEVNSLEGFQIALLQANQLCGGGPMVTDMRPCTAPPDVDEFWVVDGSTGYIHRLHNGADMYTEIVETIYKYGFVPRLHVDAKDDRKTRQCVFVKALTIDKRETVWFSINTDFGSSIFSSVTGKNTDEAMILLCETRPDMTAEKCIELFNELNYVLGKHIVHMQDFIAPEDWEMIAGVDDAMKDDRYAKS